MRSDYEPIGKHLRLADARNTAMATDRLVGINMDEYFMPSAANVIGTDLSRYKLISKGQFAM
jgi:type I restriction enzyme S subunit